MADPIVRPLSIEELREMSAEYAEIDPHALEVYNELTRTTRLLVAEIDRLAQERESGMTAGRNAVLWSIMRYRGEEGITPAEIAAALDITRATVTGLLSALEKDGLITRSHSHEDRRRVHIKPTAKAWEHSRTEWPASSADITRAMSQLTERDKTQLLKMLRKIRQGSYQARGKD